MPLEPISDKCKVCGQPRDGKPGLYCAQCRKEHNKLSMRLLRKGLSEENIAKIRLQSREHKKELYKNSPDLRQARQTYSKQQRQDPAFNLRERLRRYNISIVKYLSIFYFQGEKCAIGRCTTPGGKGDWHVDHCHKSNYVRGVLCHSHNTSLGHFKDSEQDLLKAAQYLKEHRLISCDHNSCADLTGKHDL